MCVYYLLSRTPSHPHPSYIKYIKPTLHIIHDTQVQERVKTDSEELRKVKVKPSGPWFAWADKAECESDSVFALDPWSCFFIPIGGCNNWDLHGLPFEDQSIKDLPHGLRVGLKGKEEKDGNSANSASTTGTGENGDKNEKNDKVEVGEEQDGSKFTESPPYAEYRYPYYMLLQSLEKTRFLFGDSFPGRGTGNGINHWDESRVHLFVTRPNIQVSPNLGVTSLNTSDVLCYCGVVRQTALTSFYHTL